MTEGGAVGANLSSAMGRITKTLKEEETKTVDGEQTKYVTEIEISVDGRYAPSEVTILEMNAQNKVCRETNYAPDDMPESYEPEEDTAYLLVICSAVDAEGKDTSDRMIVDRDEGSLNTYFGKDGYCCWSSTEVIWREN